MKAHTHYLWFNTKQRQEIIDITDEVVKAVEVSKVVAHLSVGVRERSRVRAGEWDGQRKKRVIIKVLGE